MGCSESAQSAALCTSTNMFDPSNRPQGPPDKTLHTAGCPCSSAAGHAISAMKSPNSCLPGACPAPLQAELSHRCIG